jgi:actin-like ATPase involved in cell morphogenesis
MRSYFSNDLAIDRGTSNALIYMRGNAQSVVVEHRRKLAFPHRQANKLRE